MANKGRPRKYESPEQMQHAVDAYFKKCEADGKGPTICGLSLALGFITRKSLLDYEGYGKNYLITIKKARLRVEAGYEANLQGTKPAGSIFALKNMGWSDRHDYSHSVAPELAQLLGLIDGSSKGKLPDPAEAQEAG
jgi:hypothetical protein